jgi:hypothetical protein
MLGRRKAGSFRVSGMTDSEIILLKTLAAKYLWWMMPDKALNVRNGLLFRL